jgi:hypothetical protein
MQAAEEQAQQLIASPRIQFSEMKARGSPDGRDVRYFCMSHSTLTGWRMERETTVLGYYLNFF